MTTSVFAPSPVDLALGSLEIAVALVLWRTLRQLRRAAPWVAVLIAFFALRGLDRLLVGVFDQRPSWLGLAIASALAVVLVLIVIGTRRTFGRLETACERARAREREYERALRDYRRMARHRLANPLASIIGSAQTLQDVPGLNRRVRVGLIEVIVEQAMCLQRVSLDPRAPLEAEEAALRPLPSLDNDGASPQGGAKAGRSSERGLRHSEREGARDETD